MLWLCAPGGVRGARMAFLVHEDLHRVARADGLAHGLVHLLDVRRDAVGVDVAAKLLGHESVYTGAVLMDLGRWRLALPLVPYLHLLLARRLPGGERREDQRGPSQTPGSHCGSPFEFLQTNPDRQVPGRCKAIKGIELPAYSRIAP